jgi:hypothetical protein
MSSSLSETVSSVIDRIFENFALLKLYILYILLYLIFHVLILPFKVWYHPKWLATIFSLHYLLTSHFGWYHALNGNIKT